MNQTAVFSETTYRLLEVIPGLDGGSYVLCESEAGHGFICPLERWEATSPPPTTKVHAKSSSQEKIALFLELFHGRDDVYAKRCMSRCKTSPRTYFFFWAAILSGRNEKSWTRCVQFRETSRW